MNICEYNSISLYLETKVSLLDRINAIDKLIDAMILSVADSVVTANIAEYNLDDGQVKVKTAYRNPMDVQNGILSLEKIKQIYVNRLNGRVFCLRDENAFRR